MATALLVAGWARAAPPACATGPACAALAQVHFTDWMYGFERGPDNETSGLAYRAGAMAGGKALAARAVELAPACSVCAVAQSTALLLDWAWDDATAFARRATALNASEPLAWAWLSKVLTGPQLDLDGALAAARTAERLAPSQLGYAVGTGAVLYFRREFGALRSSMLALLSRQPENVAAWDWLAMAHKGLGDYNASIGAYDAALRLAGRDRASGYPLTELLASLAHTYGVAGRTAEARAMLAQLYATARTRYVEPVRLAFVETSVGDARLAVDRLNDGLALRQWEFAFVRSEPWFDPLRGLPAYAAFERRVGLPPPPGAS